MQKAYKLLAVQEGISNKEAKSLIDRGLVSLEGKKVSIARAEVADSSFFKVEVIKKPNKIFEDENILAVDKPAFVDSYEVLRFFPEWVLLHRLDRETSGVILLVKDGSEFHKKAKECFRNQMVHKEYVAIVNGILSDEVEINKPILTTKGAFAKSKISSEGLSAISFVSPLRVCGKRTMVSVVIKTGRTHQIRVHLKSIGHSVFGDSFYGSGNSKRMMLHAHKIALLGYEFESDVPKEFDNLMQ